MSSPKLLLETFIDRGRHRGTCYRAANWHYLGETSGRGRQDRARTAAGAVKEIWVYPLGPHCQKKLCAGCVPRVRLRAQPADWAENEFGACRLGDARRQGRLLTLARDFYSRPTANIPQACGSRAKTKAAYSPRLKPAAAAHVSTNSGALSFNCSSAARLTTNKAG